jgi:hypothetical protein
MIKYKSLFILLLLVVYSLLLISCMKTTKKEDIFQLSPKEKFLMKIMDLGNLIGQHERVLTNVYGGGLPIGSMRIQEPDNDNVDLKVLQVNLLKEKEIFWFANEILEEIHIQVKHERVFDTFSGFTTSKEIIDLLGEPTSKYGSKDAPRIENLMYDSSRFSLHFVLSEINMDESINLDKTSKDKKEPVLKEIRMVDKGQKPRFRSILEKEIYHSGKNLYGFN